MNAIRKILPFLMMPLMLLLWSGQVQAARSFSISQTNPLSGSPLDMGTTQTVTFQITNTSGGGNAGERIYEMRFRLPGTGTVFDAATTAPVGWNRTAFSSTSVTFRATSWSNAIPSGSFLYFNLVMVMRTTTADVNETLRDARASYTLDTNFTNGITRSGRTTVNNPGSWALKSLQITSFLVTDLLGNTSVVAGNPFRVVITVRNNSSTTQNSIISAPNPPTMTTSLWTGPVPTLASTTYSPNPLTLAPGASGTITFQYNTNSGSDGNVSFAAYVRNNTNSATSRTLTSNIFSVGRFSASISVTPTSPTPGCEYEGKLLTVTMTLTNNFPYNIINITPTLTPSVGAPVVYQSGPTPAAPAPGPITASGGTLVFTWTYLLSGGNPGDLFSYTGSATGTGVTGGSPTRTTPPSTTANIKRGGYSPSVGPVSAGTSNADSTNEILRWLITNNGCADVKAVSVTIPAGWTVAATDPYFSYSLVAQDNPPNPGTTQIENVWTVSGANTVVFTAPLVPYNVLPLIPASPKQGDFRLVFATTPAVSGTSNFSIRITDTNDVFVDRTTTITVDPYNTGGRNDTNKVNWREVFQ
ncbi:MAG: hypothetical protein OEM48_06405 [Gammaproteobacteria bacterium]|nr:hypothetical protein [Gammaproteobacteria bacterium]MDH3370698.1 hypothetical protein [Gammaproteobacteria bacterium]MDH3406555.1 hypothetical protein [Gammaproteobacteria bacterium]